MKKTTPRYAPTDLERAWAAGLFEGEGSICLKRTGNRKKTGERRTNCYPRLSLSSTDRDVLDKFVIIMGVGTVMIKSTPTEKPHWKPAWTWDVTAASARHAIALMFTHLGTRRRTKALEVFGGYLEAGN